MQQSVRYVHLNSAPSLMRSLNGRFLAHGTSDCWIHKPNKYGWHGTIIFLTHWNIIQKCTYTHTNTFIYIYMCVCIVFIETYSYITHKTILKTTNLNIWFKENHSDVLRTILHVIINWYVAKVRKRFTYQIKKCTISYENVADCRFKLGFSWQHNSCNMGWSASKCDKVSFQ